MFEIALRVLSTVVTIVSIIVTVISIKKSKDEN